MGRFALVTGATGFVGTHLVERLVAAGWSVRALVRETSDTRTLDRLGVDRVVGGLTHPDSLAEAVRSVDTVFHLAAVTFGRSEAEYRRTNVEGCQLLAEAIARTAGPLERVVYLSSYAACGPAAPDGVRRPGDPPEPLTAYGRTKLGGERALAAGLADTARLGVVRAPPVYGPGDRALLPYFRMVRWGVAPSPAGGGRRLHLVYGPDLARALVRAADAPSGVFAVADGEVHSWRAITRAMTEAFGRSRGPLRLPLPRPAVRAAAALTQGAAALVGRAATFNREKAEEMLAAAWVCELNGGERLLSREEATPLGHGMAETVRWYRSHGWL